MMWLPSGPSTAPSSNGTTGAPRTSRNATMASPQSAATPRPASATAAEALRRERRKGATTNTCMSPIFLMHPSVAPRADTCAIMWGYIRAMGHARRDAHRPDPAQAPPTETTPIFLMHPSVAPRADTCAIMWGYIRAMGHARRDAHRPDPAQAPPTETSRKKDTP